MYYFVLMVLLFKKFFMKNKNTEKKNFLEIFYRNLEKDCIFNEHATFNFKKLLSYIYQINYYLKKNKLENQTVITQFENKSHTLIFYLASIFSKTTICPLDPKLPNSRIEKIKKITNSKKIIKKIKLSNIIFYDDKYFNLKNHNFLITFSSGTSGNPKGIIHSSDNILGVSKSYCQLAGYNKKTRILHCLPEYYMAGIVNTFLAGIVSTSQIFIAENFSKKSIFTIWSDIKNHKINLVYLVPSIFSMLTNFSPSSAKGLIKKNKIKFLSTSNNLYPNIRKTFFKRFKVKIKSCYGITEMGGPLTNESVGNLHHDSAGKIISGCSCKVKRLNDLNFLFFKSKFTCKFLIINGKKRKISLDGQGYFNSQDTGYIEKNNIYLTGREKDILKKGGELILLKDIENNFLTCSFVEEVAAVGIDDDLSDEKLNLYFVLNQKKSSVQNSIKILLKIIEKKLYKTEKPDKIILIKKMPKTISGKIIKRQLLSINAKDKIREVIL